MSHPDAYAGLMDWDTYAPRDERIADRVHQLAAVGLRLAEIESLILETLDLRLAAEREARLSTP